MGAGVGIGARPAPGGRGGFPGLGLIGIQESDDPCHWERVSQPWEVLATPLGAGPFRNRKIGQLSVTTTSGGLKDLRPGD